MNTKSSEPPATKNLIPFEDEMFGIVNYRVKTPDGSSLVLPFDNALIERDVQYHIRVRLVRYKGEFCICKGQLTRVKKGVYRTTPRLKQVGMDHEMPDLLVVDGDPSQIENLLEAIDRDVTALCLATKNLQAEAQNRRRARANRNVRVALRNANKVRGEFWDDSRG